jgi:dsDNA-specific endonuclease/ATPase MutS2
MVMLPLHDDDDYDEIDAEAAVQLPIDGTLDLHTFHPRDVQQLVPDYLEACRALDILQVRVVHGKGTGTLQRIVHVTLDRLDYVESYAPGGMGGGGWGATVVILRPR